MATSQQGVLDYAQSLIGKPYRWGGESELNGFDCSGLVQYVYGKAGVQLPRVSQQQAVAGQSVDAQSAQPGDLISFDNKEGPNAHIGIYLGNGYMLDAPHTGATIGVHAVSGYGTAHFTRVATPQTHIGGNKLVAQVAKNPAAVVNAAPPVGGTATSAQAGGLNAQGTTTATPKLDLNALASKYGYAAAFFNTDPSLQNLIKTAVSKQYTADQFAAQLKGTAWFKTHTDAQRSWAQIVAADPASAHAQVAQQAADILRLAAQDGANIDAMTAHQMAKDALSNGLDAAHIKQAIDAHVTYQSGGQFKGAAAGTQDQFTQLAAQYGVTLSPDTIGSWVQNTAQGKATADDFTNYVKGQALSKYPGLKDQFSQGLTTKDVADTYLNEYSNLLEVPKESLSMTDPLVQRALQYNGGTQPAAGAKAATPGAPTVMPIWQFQQQVRQDPRWQQTKNAKDSYQTAALSIGRDWGLV